MQWAPWEHVVFPVKRKQEGAEASTRAPGELLREEEELSRTQGGEKHKEPGEGRKGC